MVVDGAGVSGPLASGLARSAADLLALIEHGLARRPMRPSALDYSGS
jgi:hypothetical protein